MQTFKIFYSWQSDLPGSKTRSFIRECIDEAIDLAQETEAIEAERDEATSGTTGSPNIVTTLFSKIDDCDLFVADLSLCYTEDQKKAKRSPNPNVLFELGYAVKTLGWDRIVCLCNTDYGDQYPFDVAHNRILAFSLEGKSKREVKNDLSRIIFYNIRDIRKQQPRAKNGMATHIIGTYNYEKHIVEACLVPIDIKSQESFVLHNEELIKKASNLLVEIQELTNRISKIKQSGVQAPPELSTPVAATNPQYAEVVRLLSESYKKTETPVICKDKEKDKERIKNWLKVEVTDDFFELGGLKKVTQLLDIHNSTLAGLDEEKEKYNKLQELSYTLSLLEVRSNYLRSFEGMCFIPIAIQNISSLQDENIRVVVGIDKGEIVEPDEHLIWEEYDGFQGQICRDSEDDEDVGVICELFSLKEDGIIHVEDTPYNPSRFIPRMPTLTSHGFSQPDKTEEDYKAELEEFIASTEGRGYYEFDIKNLRPNESKWLSYGLLIKPVDNTIALNYRVYSTHSTGDLFGSLELYLE